MIYRLIKIVPFIIIMLMAACAPADLDITPSATPTPIPTATPTPEPTPEGASAQNVEEVDDGNDDENQRLLDAIVASVPPSISAWAVQWRRDTSREPEVVRNVTNGTALRVFLNEQQGGQANLTYGVFDDPEDAFNHYERIRGIRTVLQNGETLDDFPEPNLFGRGLYGSNAIFQFDNVFVEVSVEVFSSTAGNPLPGLSRAALNVAETGLAAAEAVPAVEEPEDEAEGADTVEDANQRLLERILSVVPENLPAGAAQWRLDRTRERENVRNVTNGDVVRVFYAESGGGKSSISFGVFDTEEDAANHFEFVAGLRAQLQGAQSLDDFPQPNRFNTGLYGSMAIMQMDNLYVEVFIEQLSGTVANPLTSLARGALRIVEDGLALEDTAADTGLTLLDTLFLTLPEILVVDGNQWRRDDDQIDSPIELDDGVTIGIPFLGDVEVLITIGLFDTVDSAFEYQVAAFEDGVSAVSRMGDVFILVSVQASAEDVPLAGLFNETFSLVEGAMID